MAARPDAAERSGETLNLSRSPISPERVRRVIARHFDPAGGSPFWLERAEALGFDPRDAVRDSNQLSRLGAVDPNELSRRSVWDFVPRSVVAERAGELIVVESAGTLGAPRRAVFSTAEFHEAFVAPFLAASRAAPGFGPGSRWLWIGPSGPHAIGRAVREVCAALSSPQPYEVDFDPRWFKAQREGSIVRSRYVEHVLSQTLAILDREPVDVVFGTPPILVEVSRRAPASCRRRVRGVHLGGMGLPHESALELRAGFEQADFLCGYGNSLFGLCPERAEGADLFDPVYQPHGDRLHYRLEPVDPGDDRARSEVAPGARGRIVSTRCDESFLLVDVAERDSAVRAPEAAALPAAGFVHEPFRAPRPLDDVPTARIGIY